ncbi:serine protease inhibitor 3-like [Bacillus rossius redtenbacheri]|uniref:serine protease inhibitor 3-like n=1 Tax=Bacillus rossius redtenbacheri TaxID=93214 RepID=UPI002FDDA066
MDRQSSKIKYRLVEHLLTSTPDNRTMKPAVVVLLVALILSLSLIGARACTPNTTWHDGCNSCFCSESGHAACTEMLCETYTLRAP